MRRWIGAGDAREKSVDLSGDRDLTTNLLFYPLDWRIRAVEQIRLDGAYSCARRRSLQCGPLRELLPTRWKESRATEALIVLNVAPVGRGPLLDFDVAGPLGPAYVLPRTEIAEREAHFLTRLASEAGLAMSPLCLDLITAALGLSDTAATEHYGSRRFSLTRYLEDGLGRRISPDLVREWSELSRRADQVLRSRVVGSRPLMATLDPVIAVPSMSIAASGDDAAIRAALFDYAEFLEAALVQSGSQESTSAADDLLNSIADYSISFDLLVATRVPLDEPFVVTYSERRDLKISWLTRRARQDVVLADARSNHLTLEATDANTKVHRVRARVPGSRQLTYGGFAGRQSDQYWTMYASDLDRDYRASLRFRILPLARLEVVPFAVAAVLLLLTLGLWHDRVRTIGELALIAGPSALAASVLLAREQSSLGARLRGPVTWAVAGALAVLVLSAVLLYLVVTPEDLLRPLVVVVDRIESWVITRGGL